MAMCEKCWADAFGRTMANGLPQYDNYLALLKERETKPCTALQEDSR
jgi:uncharacterized short protein YbdD (DUF466 family)